MTLATIDDVAALGGVPVDVNEEAPEYVRAVRLLELVSGLVLSYLDQFGVSEDNVEEWPEFRRDALSAIVAEGASKRLQYAAASNVDAYGTLQGPQTLKLNRWEKEAISDLLPGGGANQSVSVEVTRDFSWIGGVDG